MKNPGGVFDAEESLSSQPVPTRPVVPDVTVIPAPSEEELLHSEEPPVQMASTHPPLSVDPPATSATEVPPPSPTKPSPLLLIDSYKVINTMHGRHFIFNITGEPQKQSVTVRMERKGLFEECVSTKKDKVFSASFENCFCSFTVSATQTMKEVIRNAITVVLFAERYP